MGMSFEYPAGSGISLPGSQVGRVVMSAAPHLRKIRPAGCGDILWSPKQGRGCRIGAALTSQLDLPGVALPFPALFRGMCHG